MKLSANFLTHVTRGEHYMIPASDASVSGIVKNNETAAFIVDCLKSDTTASAIVDRILDEYDGVDRQTVERDVAGILDKLRTIGALDE